MNIRIERLKNVGFKNTVLVDLNQKKSTVLLINKKKKYEKFIYKYLNKFIIIYLLMIIL